MNKIVKQIEKWAISKDIASERELHRQFTKLVEEVGEIAECISKGKKDGLKSEIGDVGVCLIILAQQAGLKFKDCLKSASDKNETRTGNTVNGLFVKTPNSTAVRINGNNF